MKNNETMTCAHEKPLQVCEVYWKVKNTNLKNPTKFYLYEGRNAFLKKNINAFPEICFNK